MTKCERLDSKIEEMENRGYGCMFADLGSRKQVPYEMFTDKMSEDITKLYFVKMTDHIFENGLSDLNGMNYIEIEF